MDSPYAVEEHEIASVRDLFGELHSVEHFNKPWDLVRYFARKTGYEEGRIAYKLKGMLDMPTLFYIKSRIDKDMLEGKKTSYKHAFDSVMFIAKENEKENPVLPVQVDF